MKFMTYPNNNNFKVTNFKVTGIEEVLYGYLDKGWSYVHLETPTCYMCDVPTKYLDDLKDGKMNMDDFSDKVRYHYEYQRKLTLERASEEEWDEYWEKECF